MNNVRTLLKAKRVLFCLKSQLQNASRSPGLPVI